MSNFIVLEGIDGSGKTTASKYIAEQLTAKGIEHLIVESYPRDEEGLFLRDLWIQKKVPPVAVLAIVFELRKRVLFEQIIPALLEGKVVITDRWHDTTFVYQGAGDGISMNTISAVFLEQFDLIEMLNKSNLAEDDKSFIRRNVTAPPVLYLEIDAKTSVYRTVGRLDQAEDAFEKQGLDYKQRLVDGYQMHLVKAWPHRVTCVDATLPIEMVNVHIDAYLANYLKTYHPEKVEAPADPFASLRQNLSDLQDPGQVA